jgi:hypothetical protein
MNVREWGSAAQARTSIAQDLGITFRCLDRMLNMRGGELAEGIDSVRRMLPRCRFDAAKCSEGIAALENYKRKRNRSTGELSHTAEHNWASHGADAFRYLAVGLVQAGRTHRPKQQTKWIT